MSGQFFVKLNRKYIKIMDKLENQINHTKDKATRKKLIRLQGSYFSDVLQHTQARDYPVAYTASHIDQDVLLQWVSFLGKYPVQLHTALLANPHLSSTDKIVGSVIDTYIAFAYLTFINIKVVTVNLELISTSANVPLEQVQKSVKRLGRYGGFFDNSTHLNN